MVTFSNSPTNLQETLICSRKECRATAHWQILWNNPRIHEPERRKIWLACNEHQSWLEDYLAIRRLWKETKPVTGLSATAEER